jgi:hypothetical protein
VRIAFRTDTDPPARALDAAGSLLYDMRQLVSEQAKAAAGIRIITSLCEEDM